METKVRIIGLFLLGLVLGFECVFGKDLQQECSDDLTKLMGCLTYATGQAAAPSKECCSSVTGIKESEPECLCYIMQQTHNGSGKAKGLGIQEAKLFQLPSACQLKNVTLSDCPKLLGISPNSTDAAIFTNTNATTTPAGTTTPTSEDASAGNKHTPFLAASFVVAIFIHALSMPTHSA